ncbi:ribonuclease H-like domain-containing protein [Tanacetum coccineum]
MRKRRFFQKTSRKITINGSDTAGYDKYKVEYFNCNKMGHFARECKGPRKQDSKSKNQDCSKRTVNVEETSSKAMVSIDGVCFDWSYMKSLQTWIVWPFETLRIEFKSEFNLATYKRGDISYNDSENSILKSQLEKLKQEKESNQLKIENFDNAFKSLDKLSYNVVPHPHTGLFSPLNLDLSYFGLEEFQQLEFEGYGPKTIKSVDEAISNVVREYANAPLVKELVLDDKLEKKTIFPTVAKIEFVRPKQQEKPVRKPVKYAEMYRSQSPRGNQRNWNNQKSQQLGSDFVMYNKACFVCGSFDHVQADCNYHQRERVVSGNNYTRTLMNLIEDMLPLGEEPKEGKSLMCDKKNCVLFTDTECFVLSSDFKLSDESQVLLKVPRKNNMYSVDMKNIVPK